LKDLDCLRRGSEAGEKKRTKRGEIQSKGEG